MGRNVAIFRKVALDRLSSPEQLDTLLRVTAPRSWLALAALAALLAVAAAWGWFGSVTTKAIGQGVLIRTGGVQGVVTLGAGQVVQVAVNVGDRIEIGQVVAQVAQPELLEKMRAAEGQIADAEREKRDVLRAREGAIRLQLASFQRQRSNLQREIEELKEQARLVNEQISGDEELVTGGLITRRELYQTRQKLVAVQGSIAARSADITQLEANEFRTQNEGLEANLQLESRIANLRREAGALRNQLSALSRVVSPYAGQVLELKASPGMLVSAGTAILSLHPDVVQLEAVVYVPADRAKNIRPGMVAEISPSTAKREEFGFVRGRVASVADYPATEAALIRIFENAPLVRALAAGGPATEVRVQMETDPGTPSGYRWSSGRGAPMKLSGGSLCTVEIVTREQAPVTLVLPYLRETLGLR
jgi:HlyD family secretion protein